MSGPRSETGEERRRRLDAVFGDVLPETTRDERDPEDGGTADSRGQTSDREDPVEAWLKAQVPPHHGG